MVHVVSIESDEYGTQEFEFSTFNEALEALTIMAMTCAELGLHRCLTIHAPDPDDEPSFKKLILHRN